jgi:hypothetical protein
MSSCASRSTALCRELEIDASDNYHHTFVFDSQRISRYSHGALQKMRETLEGGIDMAEVLGETLAATAPALTPQRTASAR